MAINKRRYPKEEFARRGDAIYQKDVLPHLKPDDDGKFVAIDIETGDYEIHADKMTACKRLRARLDDPQPFLSRIGTLERFGGVRRVNRKPPKQLVE